MKLDATQRDYVYEMKVWYEYLIDDINNPNDISLEELKHAIDQIMFNLYKFKKTLGGTV